MEKEDIDAGIIADKELRVGIDALIQKAKDLPASRERSLGINKLQEAVRWFGMHPKPPNDGRTCYPQSHNPTNTVVEPCADGLKL